LEIVKKFLELLEFQVRGGFVSCSNAEVIIISPSKSKKTSKFFFTLHQIFSHSSWLFFMFKRLLFFCFLSLCLSNLFFKDNKFNLKYLLISTYTIIQCKAKDGIECTYEQFVHAFKE